MIRILSVFVFLILSITISAQQWEHFDAPKGGVAVNDILLSNNDTYAFTDEGVFQNPIHSEDWNNLNIPSELLEGTHHIAVRGSALLLARDSSVVYWDKNTNQGAIVFEQPFPITEPNKRVLGVHITDVGFLVMTDRHVYFSNDKGQSWELVITTDQWGAGHSYYSSFEFFVEGGDALFFIEKFDLHRSFNGGQTWELVFTSIDKLKGIFCIGSYQYLFYKNYPRVVRSSDYFLSYEAIDLDENVFESYDFSIGFHVVEYNDTLIACYYPQFSCDFFANYSTDFGATWSKYTTYEQLPSNSNFKPEEIEQINGRLLMATSIGIFSLFENNLIAKYKLFGEAEIYTIAAKDNTIVVQGESGVFTKEVGQDWILYESYQFPIDCYSYNYLGATQNAAYYNDAGVYRFSFEDKKWEHFRNGNYQYSDNLILDVVYDSVSISDGTGAVFRKLNLPNQAGFLLQNAEIVDGGILVNNFEKDYYYSFDEGQLWSVLDIDKVDISMLFMGEYDGRNISIYFHWVKRKTFVKDLDTGEETEIFPQDWTKGTLFQSPVRLKKIDNVLVAGFPGRGLFYAVDLTGRFYPLGLDVLPKEVSPIHYDGYYLWVGTKSHGIFRTIFSISIDNQEDTSNFSVRPNPVLSNFRLVSSKLPKEKGTIRIYSISGQLLYDEILYPGQFWDFNISDYPSGLYFLEIKSEEKREVLKIIKQ